jgi:hypothetical protein
VRCPQKTGAARKTAPGSLVLGWIPEIGESNKAFGITNMGTFAAGEIPFLFRLDDGLETHGADGFNASVRV